jgi:hypothetical protein
MSGIGLCGLALTLLIHILAIAGVDISSRFPFIWAMHVAVIIYFAAAVLLLLRARYPTRRLTLDILEDNLPRWVLLADGLFLAYAVVNFVLCASLRGGGNADLVNGQYLLMSHARILAHLTEHEFHLQRAYELRLFSGGWLCFWALATSYFLFWRHVPVRSTTRLLA